MDEPFSYTVTAIGFPTPTFTSSGTLPTGLRLTDLGNGSATITGTPTTTGVSHVTITATNPAGKVNLTLTLAVQEAPSFTSATSSMATVGKAGTFKVITSGYPSASVTESGVLPPGLTFTDRTNGTTTIAGTPTAAGTYLVTLIATNQAGSISQQLSVTVQQVPSFTSSSTLAGTVGTPVSLTVTTSGSPSPEVTETGTMAPGFTFSAGSDGEATVSGTPTKAGTYRMALTATNAAGSATQRLTITVAE